MTAPNNTQEKTRLHLRNRNRERYDLGALVISNPEISEYIKPNKYGNDSIDFADPNAVKILNKALLNHYYGIKNWEFPDENLCPPIPGRADYIHHVADLLCDKKSDTIPTGNKITCFDIGVGASCIYPIIGAVEYDWNFIGSDIDPKAIESAKAIINSNPSLKDKIECRLQSDSENVFTGIIDKDYQIDLSICNPPFHSSSEKAQEGSKRKIKNLTGEDVENPKLNFSGINSEIICEGGEYKFIYNMIKDSEKFAKNFCWFTTLVSKKSNIQRIYKLMEKTQVNDIRTIPMGTGNKSTRIVAWTFLTRREQQEWRETRWEKQ